MTLGSAVVSLTLSDADIQKVAQAVRAGFEEGSDQHEPWLNVSRAAEHLACSSKRIYDLKSQGRLRYAKEGGRLIFRREWLDAVVELGGERDDSEGLEPDAAGR